MVNGWSIRSPNAQVSKSQIIELANGYPAFARFATAALNSPDKQDFLRGTERSTIDIILGNILTIDGFDKNKLIDLASACSLFSSFYYVNPTTEQYTDATVIELCKSQLTYLAELSGFTTNTDDFKKHLLALIKIEILMVEGTMASISPKILGLMFCKERCTRIFTMAGANEYLLRFQGLQLLEAFHRQLTLLGQIKGAEDFVNTILTRCTIENEVREYGQKYVKEVV